MGWFFVTLLFFIFIMAFSGENEYKEEPKKVIRNLDEIKPIKREHKKTKETFIKFDYIEELVIKLFSIIAFTDKDASQEELSFIDDYIDKILDSEKYGSNFFLKKTLKSTQNVSLNILEKKEDSSLGSRALTINNVCKVLNNKLDKKNKIALLEDCLKLITSDFEVTKEEFKIADSISDKLEIGIDNELYLELKDKYLLKLDNKVLFAGNDTEQQLGIPENFNDKEKRNHILKQYQKWNARMSVISNKEEKAKAQKMLDLLSEAMKKYK